MDPYILIYVLTSDEWSVFRPYKSRSRTYEYTKTQLILCGRFYALKLIKPLTGRFLALDRKIPIAVVSSAFLYRCFERHLNEFRKRNPTAEVSFGQETASRIDKSLIGCTR